MVWHPDDWRDAASWLWGADLFNNFYFWESHEAWEELWQTTDRGTPAALLLQGLIQIAAALLKTHMQSVLSAQRLSHDGIEKLKRAAAAKPRFMGLSVATTIIEMEQYFRPLANNSLPRLNASVPILRLDWDGDTPGDATP